MPSAVCSGQDSRSPLLAIVMGIVVVSGCLVPTRIASAQGVGPIVNPANGNSYFTIEIADFDDARALASAVGGYVASLTTAVERQWAQANFGFGISTFIGLTDEAGPLGTYQWESGEPLTNTAWASGQPTPSSSPRYVIRFDDWMPTVEFAADLALIETPISLLPPISIDCSIGVGTATLTWDAAAIDLVRIYRDGTLLQTVPASVGSFTDSTASGVARYAVVAEVGPELTVPAQCSLIVPHPDLRYHLPEVVASPTTSIAPVSFLLDFGAGLGPSPGYAAGVCFDVDEVQVAMVEAGSAVLANVPNGPDFFQVGSTELGAYVSMLFSLIGQPSALLQPGPNLELAVFSFESVSGGPAFSDLQTCNTVGLPPVMSVVVINGVSVHPVLDGGSIEFSDGTFRRGDCNFDGSINVADVIFLLVHLFDATVNDYPCREACEVNGDGSIDVADAIYEISYLFTSGPPPGAPFPDCGFDPDPGSGFGCEEGFACP